MRFLFRLYRPFLQTQVSGEIGVSSGYSRLRRSLMRFETGYRVPTLCPAKNTQRSPWVGQFLDVEQRQSMRGEDLSTAMKREIRKCS